MRFKEEPEVPKTSAVFSGSSRMMPKSTGSSSRRVIRQTKPGV